MERKPKEISEGDQQEALNWLLKEKEGKDIKILDPKTERKGREAAKKLFNKKISEFGQKELFKENI